MPKRKRDGETPDQQIGTEDQALQDQVARLKARIAFGNKSLLPALKLARGLERQKLGRRQKQSAHDPHNLLRLREEVIVLKQLDLERTAKNYLLKQLTKAKTVRESRAFKNIYISEPTIDTLRPGAEANVIGRLFSSNPVKQVLPEIMTGIFDVLGLRPSKPGNKQDKRDSKGSKDSKSNRDEGHEYKLAFSNAESENDELDNAKPKVAPTDNSQVSQEETDDDISIQDVQIASEEESWGGLESESDLQDYPNEQPSQDRQSHPKPSSTTTFLPSLSMGGYYSGSESDDDDEFSRQPPQLQQPRKNRRGQRARQQLAEWKHGKNAKHLQKQQGKSERDAGWDSRRGAVGTNTRSSNRSGQVRNSDSQDTRPKEKGQFNASKKYGSTKDDQGTLHPSWEAAKKKKMQSISQVAFEGKKIIFD